MRAALLSLFACVFAVATLAGCADVLGFKDFGTQEGDASIPTNTGDASTPPADDASGDVTSPGDGSPGPGDAEPEDGASDAPIGDSGVADAAPGTGCTSTELFCGTACVPNDTQHCGTCTHDCTDLKNVSGTVSCSAGVCGFDAGACAAGFAHCAGSPDLGCETSIITSANCGACGNACGVATPVCASSGASYSCSSGCPAATPTLCGSSCVSTATDAQNCGMCSNVCTTTVAHATATCVASKCTPQCTASYPNMCGSSCVNFQTDNSNCGACGTACTGNAQCVSGSCQCTGSTHLCSAACVANDVNACGTSCTKCAAPTGGTATCNGTSCGQSCTTAGNVVCGTTCVSTSTDANNCGSCGHVCTGGETCVSGSCQCPAGTSMCGSTCVNTVSNAANCGACGHSCLNGGCSSSTCSPWTVYKPSGGVAGIACDGTNLVWLDSSLKVLQAAAAGGTTTPMQLAQVASSDTFLFIRMAGGVVVFTAKDSSSLIDLFTANESSATSVQFSPVYTFGAPGDPNVERGLATTGGTAYFEYFDDFSGQGNVESCSLALNNPGCTMLQPSTAGEFPDDLTIGSSSLFWTQNANSLVAVLPLPSTTLANEATGQNGPYLITTDSTYVYWANQAIAATTFTINRNPQTGANAGAPKSVLGSTPGTAGSLAADGKYVYYGGSFSTYEVGYVPAVGGSSKPLVTGSGTASFVVTAGGAIYYVDSTDGAIHGVAAPP